MVSVHDVKDVCCVISRMDAKASVSLARLVLDAVTPAYHLSRGDGRLFGQQERFQLTAKIVKAKSQ